METEPIGQLVQTSVFEKDQASWDSIRSSVYETVAEAFAWSEKDPVLGKIDDQRAYENLEAAFLAQDTTVVIQKHATGALVGFSLAMPVGKFDSSRAEDSDTAYVYMTTIAKEQRGKKLVVPVNRLMMQELQNKGYAFAERDVMYGFDEEGNQITEGGYPQSIEKGFGTSVIDAYDYTPYEQYGLQRHFRIDIRKFLENQST